MNHICTWLCADEKGEESLFPQTGRLSSSASHQEIYWRCVLLFFITSRRYNKEEHHVFFTNVRKLPDVDGRNVADILDELQVDVVHSGFRYKTPKGYYGAFQNQFYEFSILEEIVASNPAENDLYLIVDSDCIFIKPASHIFNAGSGKGFLSYRDDVKPDYVINGLSRNQLRQISGELLGKVPDQVPDYHFGEFFLASVGNIRKLSRDFLLLWPVLLERHAAGKLKFNEEAHTLSYLYFINGFEPELENIQMKRVWTNPLFYRNVEESDMDLSLWHLPSEKTFGLRRLYDRLITETGYGSGIPDDTYVQLASDTLGVPRLSLRMRLRYYTMSYYRAVRKRLPRFKPNKTPYILKSA